MNIYTIVEMVKESKLFCEFIYCGCGCKKTLPKYGYINSVWVVRRFINGHNTRLYGGNKHPSWKGGNYINTEGYRIIWVGSSHPYSNHKGYVTEHRLVMEKHLGRFLNDNEVVHHINHIKTDNRIENLQLMLATEHISLHHKLEETEKRLCDVCNQKTYRKGNGILQWCKNPNNKLQIICQNCYGIIWRSNKKLINGT